MKKYQRIKHVPKQTLKQRLAQLESYADTMNHRYFAGRFSDEMAAIQEHVSWLHYLAYLVSFTFVGGSYLYVLTANVLLSAIIGCLGAFFAIHYVVTLPKKQRYRLETLGELNHYATTVVFNLEAGENPYNALQTTVGYLREPVRSDVAQVVTMLENTAQLETTHMKQYRFAPLDIFHQTLAIKREQGGNTKMMFESVLNHLYFQVVKHDELAKRKKYVRKQVFVIGTIALLIPLVIRYAAPTEFLVFQHHWLGQSMAVFVYAGFGVLFAKTQAEALELDLL